MKKKIAIDILIMAAVLSVVLMCCTPVGRIWWNSYDKTMKKIDDATTYESQKKVEDSCRTMIASYTSDRMTYEIYRNSQSAEQRTWAEEARIRANKTAASYNNFILVNSFVWEGNVPEDIQEVLPYLTIDE